MTRLLDTDLRLRKLCLIKPGEAGYPRSVLSRFIRRVGEDNLVRIIEKKVVNLLIENNATDVDAVFDASFIKAWSTRDPVDNQTGYSDREARVGRAGRTFGLGYKLHLAIDSQTMLPLTCALKIQQKSAYSFVTKIVLIKSKPRVALSQVFPLVSVTVTLSLNPTASDKDS